MPHTYTWTCDQCGKKSGKSPGSPMGWAAVSIRLNRGVLGRTKHLCEMHTAILLKRFKRHGTGTAGEGE